MAVAFPFVRLAVAIAQMFTVTANNPCHYISDIYLHRSFFFCLSFFWPLTLFSLIFIFIYLFSQMIYFRKNRHSEEIFLK